MEFYIKACLYAVETLKNMQNIEIGHCCEKALKWLQFGCVLSLGLISIVQRRIQKITAFHPSMCYILSFNFIYLICSSFIFKTVKIVVIVLKNNSKY